MKEVDHTKTYDSGVTEAAVDLGTTPSMPPLWVWDIPSIVPGDALLHVEAVAGATSVIVGANGAGKSALGLWLEQSAGVPVRRLIAHRRLWFEHAGPAITSAQRTSTRTNMSSWSRAQESRWLDHADAQRASLVLFDFIAKVNGRNGRLAAMHDAGSPREVIDATIEESVLDRLNRILSSAGLPVRMRLTDQDTLHAVNQQQHGTEYPIFRMSDGEKAALLLAAEILTSDEGILIIDEPERHLHRAISAGLIEAVIADRPDCHFVVLTHDLELATALNTSAVQTFALNGCAWQGDNVSGWELFAVDPEDNLPEAARQAILGGRRDLLFIEGDQQSLDLRLYRILFPSWTIFPAGGCEQVIRTVTGLGASTSHHWIRARGIVDGDGRTVDEVAALAAKGVLALPVSEVESLYYTGAVMAAVADRQAATLGVAASQLMSTARQTALGAVRQGETPARLAAGVAESVAHRRVLEAMPDRANLASGVDPLTVTLPSPFPALLSCVNTLLSNADLEGLVRLVAIRDSGLPNLVAVALGFRRPADYEAAARARIASDSALVGALHTLIGPMPAPPSGV